MLFRVQWRDALRAALFALVCYYVLPVVLAGFTFAGNAITAGVVGVILSLTYLVTGSAICHTVRCWCKRPDLESKLMVVWFGLLTAATAGVLLLLAQGLGSAVVAVHGWDSALAAGLILTVVAALSATGEPRK